MSEHFTDGLITVIPNLPSQPLLARAKSNTETEDFVWVQPGKEGILGTNARIKVALWSIRS